MLDEGERCVCTNRSYENSPLYRCCLCRVGRELLGRQPAVQGHEVDLRVGGGLYGSKEDLGRGGEERVEEGEREGSNMVKGRDSRYMPTRTLSLRSHKKRNFCVFLCMKMPSIWPVSTERISIPLLPQPMTWLSPIRAEMTKGRGRGAGKCERYQ